ncbi:Na+/H+ antiporter [Cryptosporangium aurantiacum]|uniref:Sodium/proton antiporter, CPA1 family n=1 Tax=Cryptosporangium aurantiacum TaxID=134849 RepID=A0A1M7RP69_9ACTN|nr:Na+/H+ antiporter [Cryptosporangium aurantiacum]SHN48019.1 sodium/proton antiporter, CPA1 family [Cryptosporangium aurantiacum]
MTPLVLVLILLLGVVLVSPLADRFGVPAPVALTVFGAVLALLPDAPTELIEPHLVLPLFLPPLLFAAAQRSSRRDFTRNWTVLLALAVGLVLVTTAVVAVVARWVDPSLTLYAAIALGAVVSPPDPVAATSLAGRLGLPKRLVAVLEGEGLINDALALVIYTTAVSAALTDSFSVADAAGTLAVSVLVGPLVGLAVGWVGRALISRLSDPRAEVGLSLLLPYAAYLGLEELGGSGVLAVVVAGLMLGQGGSDAYTGAGFLAGGTVWRVADWMIGGFAFGLVGFELVRVVLDPGVPTYGVGVATAVCVAAIATRALFVLPLGWVAGRRMRRSAESHGWRESTVVSWAGMRGVVTLATALALPADFPGRPVVLFAAIAVVVVTLVGQGLTLPWLVRALGVRSPEEEQGEINRARAVAAGAALARLDELHADGRIDDEIAEAIRRRYARTVPGLRADLPADVRQRILDVSRVSRHLREAEQAAVLSLRSEGEVSTDAADRVLRDIAARTVRDLYHAG